MEYLATFYTHFGAIQFKRRLQAEGIEAEAMPVPRRFSSNCGIGVRFRTSIDVLMLINSDIEKVFLMDESGRAVYANAEE